MLIVEANWKVCSIGNFSATLERKVLGHPRAFDKLISMPGFSPSFTLRHELNIGHFIGSLSENTDVVWYDLYGLIQIV